MNSAIVLGGGGSRGAYHIGAWKALREMNLKADMAFGTSIGSINACLIAQNQFELGEELWDTISVDKVMQDGINLDFDLERMMNQTGNIKPFIISYAKGKKPGADISPFIDLLKKTVDENKVRESKINLGMVTVRFPSLTPCEITIDQIPNGELLNYLLASSACFPAFPMHRIGKNSFIDGSYFDRLPIDLAIRNGADEIIAIDLNYKPTHPQYEKLPFIKYIKPSKPLGSILLFDQDIIQRNKLMGYYDTLKAFNNILGFSYNFNKDDTLKYEILAKKFILDIVKIESDLIHKHAITKNTSKTPFTNILLTKSAFSNPSNIDLLLKSAETCAKILKIESIHLYTIRELNSIILSRLPLEKAKILIDDFNSSKIPKLISSVSQIDSPLLIACILIALKKQKTLPDIFLKFISTFPTEAICAYYLYSTENI